MSKIADKITNYIMIKGMIDKDDYDIYHYGFQTGIEFILCLAISVIMASSLGLIREFAIIILVLLPLRAYICGIHMKKFVSCLFCSVALVTCGPYLVQKIMISNHIVLCLSVIAIVILHKCSYITTEYQCDSDEVTYFASIRKRILLCVFMAEVTNNDGDVIATGTAYEKENSTFINKTSYIENCETSAVGRALGMAGFGIDTSVASAEEVANAIENQKEDKKVILATEKQVEILEKLMTNEQKIEACKLVGKNNLKEFTVQEASSLIKKLKGGN